MSRRMDREGVPRHQTQFVKNQRTWSDPRCVENERGWIEPFANWQCWDEFNQANYALRCLMLWWRRPRLSQLARIESDLRSFHFHLHKSRKCDRPKLP